MIDETWGKDLLIVNEIENMAKDNSYDIYFIVQIHCSNSVNLYH